MKKKKERFHTFNIVEKCVFAIAIILTVGCSVAGYLYYKVNEEAYITPNRQVGPLQITYK